MCGKKVNHTCHSLSLFASFLSPGPCVHSTRIPLTLSRLNNHDTDKHLTILSALLLLLLFLLSSPSLPPIRASLVLSLEMKHLTLMLPMEHLYLEDTCTLSLSFSFSLPPVCPFSFMAILRAPSPLRPTLHNAPLLVPSSLVRLDATITIATITMTTIHHVKSHLLGLPTNPVFFCFPPRTKKRNALKQTNIKLNHTCVLMYVCMYECMSYVYCKSFISLVCLMLRIDQLTATLSHGNLSLLISVNM